MSTREKLIKARLSMPALAEQLKNVSPACQRAGISRTRGYEIKQPPRSMAPKAWRRSHGGLLHFIQRLRAGLAEYRPSG